MLRAQLRPALVALLVSTLLLGLAYPLAITGVGQLILGSQADGSLIERDGELLGSELIGRDFSASEYFLPRPSAVGYDGAGSGASNLGPSSPELLGDVEERVRRYRSREGLAAGDPVPVDAVTSSGSGLDPHISPANARLQAPRVAAARGLPLAEVENLIAAETEGPALGFLGEEAVNVQLLNLALDERG